MNRILFSRKLKASDHAGIFKSLFIFTNLSSILIYAFLRLVFLNSPIPANEDVMMALKTLLIGSLSAIILYLAFVVIEIADYIISERKLRPVHVLKYAGIAAFAMIIIHFTSCKAKLNSGINKDFNTGLTTTYKNLKPENSLLLMNEQVLDHAGIPLGEKFVMINDNVKGLTEKDGKASAGCSLVIKDKKGKTILHEDDLFKGDDVFIADKARLLQCSIATGKPMKQQQKYDVAVVFWDKYGTGRIENSVSVTMK